MITPLSFNGRFSRRDFLFSSIIGSGLMYGLLESIEFFPSSLSFELSLMSYGCLALLLLWFIYASGTKRCHDLGDQGIFQMVPLYVFWMVLAKGDSGVNQFGRPPRDDAAGEGDTHSRTPGEAESKPPKSVYVIALMTLSILGLSLLVLFHGSSRSTEPMSLERLLRRLAYWAPVIVASLAAYGVWMRKAYAGWVLALSMVLSIWAQLWLQQLNLSNPLKLIFGLLMGSQDGSGLMVYLLAPLYLKALTFLFVGLDSTTRWLKNRPLVTERQPRGRNPIKLTGGGLMLAVIAIFAMANAPTASAAEKTPEEKKLEAREEFNLASRYRSGDRSRGIAKDPAEAVKHYLKAAELGNPNAQRWLGDSYQHGFYFYGEGNEHKGRILSEKNEVKAVKWYRKAADGDRGGFGALGLEIMAEKIADREAFASGVPLVASIAFFKVQAMSGDKEAQYMLAHAYAFGVGVEEDDVEAYAYYALAGIAYMEFGSINASELRADFANPFPKDQLDIPSRIATAGKARLIELKALVKLMNTADKPRLTTENHDLPPLERRSSASSGRRGRDAPVFALRSHNNLSEPSHFMVISRIPNNVENRLMWWIHAAEQGDKIAQGYLGLHYLSTNDLLQANVWFRKAADQGDAIAQNQLGYAYAIGEGANKDAIEAYAYTQVSGDKEDLAVISSRMTPAEIVAGQKRADEIRKLIGSNAAMNKSKDLALPVVPVARMSADFQALLHKAEQGDPIAQCQLGRGYDRGFSENKTRGEGGFPKRDETVALVWYLKSAVQGNVEATRAMSDKSHFKNGRSIQAGDDDALAEQIKWSLLSSGYEKYSKSITNNSGIVITDQIRADGELRAKTFRDQNKLVAKYSEASKAADLATLKAKAEAGSAEDQWILGNRYNLDTSDGGHVAEALNWWRKAAEQGHAKAQNNLGHCYASGTGVSKDPAVALSYYRKSADQGNAVALNNMGRFYALGVDVPKDEVQAYAYWSVASKKSQTSKVNLYQLETRLTKESVLLGQRRAKELANVIAATTPAGTKETTTSRPYSPSDLKGVFYASKNGVQLHVVLPLLPQNATRGAGLILYVRILNDSGLRYDAPGIQLSGGRGFGDAEVSINLLTETTCRTGDRYLITLRGDGGYVSALAIDYPDSPRSLPRLPSER